MRRGDSPECRVLAAWLAAESDHATRAMFALNRRGLRVPRDTDRRDRAEVTADEVVGRTG